MEVLDRRESFEEMNGVFKYAHILIVYRVGDDVYYAMTKSQCRSAAEVKVEELSNVVIIPTTMYCPLFPSTYTQAPDPLPPNCYIKGPHFLSYDRIHNTSNASWISEWVLKEAEVCEIFKLHLHPSIAQYLGCQVRNGRIAGICFAKYSDSLMQRVNPKSRMNRAFIYDGRALKNPSDCSCVVERGIRYLTKVTDFRTPSLYQPSPHKAANHPLIGSLALPFLSNATLLPKPVAVFNESRHQQAY